MEQKNATQDNRVIILTVLRELLTHKDMATTQRYAHLRPDAVRGAALKSGEPLTPKHGRVLKIVK